MPAFGIKLADANVWLAFAADAHRHHLEAVKWFSAQSDASCAFCRITQLALLRHLTNSRIMGENVLSQANAWLAFDRLRSDPRVIFLDEPPGLEQIFRALTHAESPSHERWTDAYLASFAAASGLQLVTFDGGYESFRRS
jgi:uncharacterized protein